MKLVALFLTIIGLGAVGCPPPQEPTKRPLPPITCDTITRRWVPTDTLDGYRGTVIVHPGGRRERVILKIVCDTVRSGGLRKEHRR